MGISREVKTLQGMVHEHIGNDHDLAHTGHHGRIALVTDDGHRYFLTEQGHSIQEPPSDALKALVGYSVSIPRASVITGQTIENATIDLSTVQKSERFTPEDLELSIRHAVKTEVTDLIVRDAERARRDNEAALGIAS